MESINFIALKNLDAAQNVEVINYLNKVLGHQVNEQVWNWEFNTNKNTVFTLLKDEKKIIATQSMLPINLSIDGKTYSTAKSESSYLEADYRGKKLFEKLYAFAIENTVNKGSVAVWGFTPAVKAWKNNFQFNVHEGLIKYIEVQTKYYSFSTAQKNSNNFFNVLLKYAGKNCITIISKVKLHIYLSIKKTINVYDELINKSDLLELYNNLREDNKGLINIEMSEAYFDWRITQNIAINYSTKFFYESNKIVGYTVYAINNDRIMIADLTYKNIVALKYIIKYLSGVKGEFTRLYYWGNDNCSLNANIFKTFEKIGGKVKEDKSRNFIYKTFGNQDLRSLTNLTNWYINGLWTEGFYI